MTKTDTTQEAPPRTFYAVCRVMPDDFSHRIVSVTLYETEQDAKVACHDEPKPGEGVGDADSYECVVGPLKVGEAFSL